MGRRIPASLPEHCASCTAPRFSQAPKQRHQLIDRLVMAVYAVMGGAEGGRTLRRMAGRKPCGVLSGWTYRMAFPVMTPCGGCWRGGTRRN